MEWMCATLRPSKMYAFSLAVVLLGLFHNIVALEVPSEFNCKNSLISDEWRREVLKFHNDYRRRVAEGKQATKGGTMPAAKDMNELTWDCNIEYQALQQSCDNNPQLPTNTANPPLPYSRLVADFKMNSNCNKSSVTTDKLKEWWNEVKTVDLTQTVEYTADIKNFGQMVNSKVTGFACTYNKCDSGGKLVCMYDSSRDDTTNKVLYDKGGTCTCQDCVKFLCQPDYKVSTVTEPQPLAIDGMTYDQEMLALRLTNYYRRLLATGWAEDSKGYAKWAAKMPPLAYEAPIAVHAKSEADDCDKTTYTPDAANSLNFFKGSYQDTIEKTIEEVTHTKDFTRGRVWRSGKRLAAHAHGRWFNRASGQPTIHASGCPPASHYRGHIHIEGLYDAHMKSNVWRITDLIAKKAAEKLVQSQLNNVPVLCNGQCSASRASSQLDSSQEQSRGSSQRISRQW
ncbi:hypothetical protein Y032_0119g811 [Ancylostoma ceylanicum]|uniref:SCP domain-containing protein n=2 Tax=Ancylostoma ceylanicum TaxID=53326 RepID=A0A016TB24_9BILA|nr:hypothetical protein Y032_0119g811 [Ancylostoma ceylanicum]